nr:MAG TPA: hypothetical protein [Caudoviricetes sp.]
MYRPSLCYQSVTGFILLLFYYSVAPLTQEERTFIIPVAALGFTE